MSEALTPFSADTAARAFLPRPWWSGLSPCNSYMWDYLSLIQLRDPPHPLIQPSAGICLLSWLQQPGRRVPYPRYWAGGQGEVGRGADLREDPQRCLQCEGMLGSEGSLPSPTLSRARPDLGATDSSRAENSTISDIPAPYHEALCLFLSYSLPLSCRGEFLCS